jgi:hypothetical protein
VDRKARHSDPRSRIPWIEKHVIPAIPSGCVIQPTLRQFRDVAWTAHQSVVRRVTKTTGQAPLIVVENGYPVETKFLADCTADDLVDRRFKGPFPLHEVATFVHSFQLSAEQQKNLDRREPNELPYHNPQADARQSLRIWIEAEELGRAKKLT